MGYIGAHALGLALILLLFQATGMLVVRTVPALDGVASRTGVVRIGLGIAVWMYGLFALASVGLLRRPILRGAMVAVFIAAAMLHIAG